MTATSLERHVTRRLGVVAAAALAASCSASPAATAPPLWTQPPDSSCYLALVLGTLAPDPVSGLGLIAGGQERPVRWPPGYSATIDGGALALADSGGRIVAHVGDNVTFGGGEGAGSEAGVTLACPNGPVTFTTQTPWPRVTG